MSSMPAPVATAGRGTRRGTDTAWQSIIVVAECLPPGALSTTNGPEAASRVQVPPRTLGACPRSEPGPSYERHAVRGLRPRSPRYVQISGLPASLPRTPCRASAGAVTPWTGPRFAVSRLSLYHRGSMVVVAESFASPVAGRPGVVTYSRKVFIPDHSVRRPFGDEEMDPRISCPRES